MSPKSDNQNLSAKLDVTVDIPHGGEQTPPAPATAPPLPEIEPLPIRPINIVDNAPTPQPASMAVPPIFPDEFHQHEARRWPVILMYTFLAFLVALLVVFAGRWVYQKTTHKTTKTAKPESADTSKLPALPPASTGTNNTAPTSTQLPNNGPGDVLAIFVATALAVGGLHFLYNLRRQN